MSTTAEAPTIASLASAGVDVCGDHTFTGYTARLLGCVRDALRAEPVDGRVEVTLILHKGFLAIHDTGTSLLS